MTTPTIAAIEIASPSNPRTRPRFEAGAAGSASGDGADTARECGSVWGRMALARSLVLGDSADTWTALGFSVDFGKLMLGDVLVVLSGEGGGIRELGVEGLTGERPDGLALTRVAGPLRAPERSAHPNGASVIDHVVAFSDSLERTAAALDAVGLDLRRRRDPPQAPLPQGFFNLGSLVLEVGEVAEGPPRFWGLVVVVGDLEAAGATMGDALGTPRDAVQPGRQIATVRREAGLGCALAFMTPRG